LFHWEKKYNYLARNGNPLMFSNILKALQVVWSVTSSSTPLIFFGEDEIKVLLFMWTSKLPHCDFIWRCYFWEPPQLWIYVHFGVQAGLKWHQLYFCRLFDLIILCITPLHPCFDWWNLSLDKFLLHQMLYWTLTTPSLLITAPRGPSASIHIHYLNSI